MTYVPGRNTGSDWLNNIFNQSEASILTEVMGFGFHTFKCHGCYIYILLLTCLLFLFLSEFCKKSLIVYILE